MDIPRQKTLTIPEGATLTINKNVTLTNNGEIINKGTLTNNGTINGNGSYSGTGTVNKASQTAPRRWRGYTISYTKETITVDSGYEANTARSFTGTAIATGASLVDYMNSSLYIRKAESAFYAASSVTEINVPARPIAPTLTIDNEVEGVTLAKDYCYNTTGADYSTNTWTPGAGSKVIVTPRDSIYIYKAATASDFKSVVQTLTAPSRGTTPNVSINFTDETLTTTAMQYIIGASGHGVQSWTDCDDSMAASAFGWDGSAVTVQFRTAATENEYASEQQEVIIPARPATPAGLQGSKTSFAGESDGEITGLDSSKNYQISSDGGKRWKDITLTTEGEITGLAAGTYQVRVKATTSTFASEASEAVKVESGPSRTYELEVTAPHL